MCGNCFIFLIISKLNIPSFEKKYDDNNALTNVFPLLGYEANQTIIRNIFTYFFLNIYKKHHYLHPQ